MPDLVEVDVGEQLLGGRFRRRKSGALHARQNFANSGFSCPQERQTFIVSSVTRSSPGFQAALGGDWQDFEVWTRGDSQDSNNTRHILDLSTRTRSAARSM